MTRDELQKVTETCIGKPLNGVKYVPAPDPVILGEEFLKNAGAIAIVSIMSKPFTNGTFQQPQSEGT